MKPDIISTENSERLEKIIGGEKRGGAKTTSEVPVLTFVIKLTKAKGLSVRKMFKINPICYSDQMYFFSQLGKQID